MGHGVWVISPSFMEQCGFTQACWKFDLNEVWVCFEGRGGEARGVGGGGGSDCKEDVKCNT